MRAIALVLATLSLPGVHCAITGGLLKPPDANRSSDPGRAGFEPGRGNR